MVRLQKFLADAGVASRRASEQIILEGRVTVNGTVANTLGAKVDPEHDKVSVDGKAVQIRRKLYVVVNKPPGFISSRSDPEDRRSVNDLLPAEWRNLYSVGRLDYESEGLLLFTNDGDFSLRLTHPRYGIQKVYHVSVRGRAETAHMRAMEKGIYSEGELLRAHRARILHAGNGSLIEVVLRQGKNREVRRMCEAQELEVERLVRVQIGPLKMGELPRGKWRVLNPGEVKSLLNWTETFDHRSEAPPGPPERPGPRVDRPPMRREGPSDRPMRPMGRPNPATRRFDRSSEGPDRPMGRPARAPGRFDRPARPMGRPERSPGGAERPFGRGERPVRGGRSFDRGGAGPDRERSFRESGRRPPEPDREGRTPTPRVARFQTSAQGRKPFERAARPTEGGPAGGRPERFEKAERPMRAGGGAPRGGRPFRQGEGRPADARGPGGAKPGAASSRPERPTRGKPPFRGRR